MKINHCLLGALAAASLVCGEEEALKEVTLHNVTFQEVKYKSGLQNYSPDSSNFYLVANFCTQGNLGTNGNAIQGLYMDSNSGLKLNGDQGTVTVSYLYLDPSIQFAEAKTGDNISEGVVSWGSTHTTKTFELSASAGSWLDINRDYGNHISTAQMNGGTVYLNGLGHLNSQLGKGNTLVATAVILRSTLENNSTLFQLSEIEGTNYTLVTRTLMTGDFSTWSAEDLASVQLEGYSYSAGLADATSYTMADLTKYYVTADSNGLSVSWLIPEPATATLSLLALAALAARRRRK